MLKKFSNANNVANVLNVPALCQRIYWYIVTPDPFPAVIVANVSTKKVIWKNILTYIQVSIIKGPLKPHNLIKWRDSFIKIKRNFKCSEQIFSKNWITIVEYVKEMLNFLGKKIFKRLENMFRYIKSLWEHSNFREF